MAEIKFITPTLAEGPDILFSIPVSEGFPFAVEVADGKYGLPITITVLTTWFIMLFFAIIFKFFIKNLQVKPDNKQALFETIYGFYDSTVGQILGKFKDKYLAYISALLSFIFVANIIGFFPIPWFRNGILGPAFRAPTADLNTTIGLALITTAVFLYSAIKYNGLGGYFKGLLEPSPLLLPLNIIGEISKPLNISMRLFGNIFSGIIIMGLLYGALPILIPVPLHLYFDLFSGAIQSFVFVMLTLVYIQMAIGDVN